jgi:GNAT superfamily N-acetyltransferase
MSFALQTNTMVLPPPPRLLARHRGYSFHEERFNWLRHEGEQLFEQHYREASADLSVPLEVNWQVFERMEQAGLEACVTVRKAGELVGYAVYFLAPHMHYRYTIADADVFFLDPAHRSGWLGVKLLRIAEDLLREKGVSEVWNRVKLHVKPGRGGRTLGVLFRSLGYRPVEVSYRKRIA